MPRPLRRHPEEGNVVSVGNDHDHAPDRKDPQPTRLRPGLYAVSASLVKGLPWRVYDSAWGPFGRDNWGYYPVWFNAFRYFDGLTPVDRVGHSIDLYRVTPEQADEISSRLWGPGATPR